MDAYHNAIKDNYEVFNSSGSEETCQNKDY